MAMSTTKAPVCIVRNGQIISTEQRDVIYHYMQIEPDDTIAADPQTAQQLIYMQTQHERDYANYISSVGLGGDPNDEPPPF